MVGGMDNVVEVAFSRGGERFVTNTNIQFVGQPRKDGILHAVYGGVYPKDILPVYGFPWSGPRMMPELVSWGAMSPCGLTRYESEEFGVDYRDNLFSCLFSGHKVLRQVLEPHGATFTARDEEFLACEDVRFHPTDVLEDADGSLLVIETGGWYLHCCPSSTFYRPEHHGAVYRIRRKGAHRIEDPRGRRLDWAAPTIQDLSKRLSDNRPMVRRRAADQLRHHAGAAAVPVLRNVVETARSADARCLAVWAATSIDDQSARQVARLALNDSDDTVRHAAISSISLWRDRMAVEQLLEILKQSSAHHRRVAAEALGRIGDVTAVPVLLDTLSEPVDRFLEHSLTFALIEIADPELTRAGLTAGSIHTRRAAMIALDQMRTHGRAPIARADGHREREAGTAHEADLVIAQLDSPDGKMQETAWWLISQHPREWGALLAEKLRARVAGAKLAESDRQVLVTRLARVARTPGVADWIATELSRSGASAETQILLLNAMADAGGYYADNGWIKAMLDLLTETGNATVVSEAVASLRKQPPILTNTEVGRSLHQAFNEKMRQVGQRASVHDDTRLASLSAIHGDSVGAVADALFGFLLTKIGPDEPFAARGAAADVLSRSQLTESQLLRLSGSLKNVAATELNPLLGLFEDQKSDSVGKHLVASLLASAAATTLNAFRLKNCLAGFGTEVHDRARPLFERLEQAQAEQLAKARRITQLATDADPMRGMQVFHGNKAACIACHKTSHVGTTIGPNLHGIGRRRTVRDLVESILFPSASLVQSYESWTVETTDGRAITGTIQKDTPEELVLSAGPDKTTHIPRDAIQEMTRDSISIMPKGLDKILTEQQLADLVAYLKSLR